LLAEVESGISLRPRPANLLVIGRGDDGSDLGRSRSANPLTHGGVDHKISLPARPKIPRGEMQGPPLGPFVLGRTPPRPQGAPLHAQRAFAVAGGFISISSVRSAPYQRRGRGKKGRVGAGRLNLTGSPATVSIRPWHARAVGCGSLRGRRLWWGLWRTTASTLSAAAVPLGFHTVTPPSALGLLVFPLFFSQHGCGALPRSKVAPGVCSCAFDVQEADTRVERVTLERVTHSTRRFPRSFHSVTDAVGHHHPLPTAAAQGRRAPSCPLFATSRAPRRSVVDAAAKIPPTPATLAAPRGEPP